MFLAWSVVLLASRGAYADFHFLNCVSSGPSVNPIPTNPTIAVPTSDMANCAGILGERMVILENLTQPVGTASVFSIVNFCDARRLDVYLASSDLLGIFISGGDGTLIGECSPSPAKSYSCISPNLSLNCSDSAGSVTTQLPIPIGTSSVSVTPSTSSKPNSGTELTPSGADNSGGTACFSPSSSRFLPGGADEPAKRFRPQTILRLRRYPTVAPVVETVRPFLATETFHSSMPSSKLPRPASLSFAGPSSPPDAHEEIRSALQARSRSIVMSWRTDALPPSYSHRGEGNEYQGG
ncbi:hypothetical protein DFH09DRAFT_1178883 [Mycena vulgaris]|nr:hypothetical protein DFH09DRAFT_1178883 [Mycena vulgaris]